MDEDICCCLSEMWNQTGFLLRCCCCRICEHEGQIAYSYERVMSIVLLRMYIEIVECDGYL